MQDQLFETTETVEEVVEYVKAEDLVGYQAPTATTATAPTMLMASELSSQFVDDSALRKWERDHAEFLASKSKKSEEEHKRLLEEAKQDTKQFYDERARMCETKMKQNKIAEEEHKTAQERLFSEGTVWEQAASLLDFGAKPQAKASTSTSTSSTTATAATAAQLMMGTTPSTSQAPNAAAAKVVDALTQKQQPEIDTSRSRQLLIDLKNEKKKPQ